MRSFGARAACIWNGHVFTEGRGFRKCERCGLVEEGTWVWGPSLGTWQPSKRGASLRDIVGADEAAEWGEKQRAHKKAAQQRARAQGRTAASDDHERACAWVEYRKDYGVSGRDVGPAHKAFCAGWKAAREGDQSGVLR